MPFGRLVKCVECVECVVVCCACSFSGGDEEAPMVKLVLQERVALDFSKDGGPSKRGASQADSSKARKRPEGWLLWGFFVS